MRLGRCYAAFSTLLLISGLGLWIGSGLEAYSDDIQNQGSDRYRYGKTINEGDTIDGDGCTVIVVGKEASSDGSVINSHNADGGYDSGLKIIPAADHEPGQMAPVYSNITHADLRDMEKLGEIPQVGHTYQYFHIAYPFGNEHQVMIGEHTIGGHPKCKPTDQSKAIMWIEQLEVFCLQRAKTARECVQVMGELAENYGYKGTSGGSAEVLSVSDPNEAWIFEIFGVGPKWTPDSGKPGAVWCAQRVPDDHIYVSPNMSRIDRVDASDSENFMVSSHYLDTAVELGIYSPESGRPFSWRDTYGYVWPANNESSRWARLWRALTLLAPSAEGPGGYGWTFGQQPDYPFSVKPDKPVSFQDVYAVLTDMNIGTKYDNTEHKAWYVRARDGSWVKSPLATPQPSSEMMALLQIPYWRPGSIGGCSYHFVSQSRNWMPNDIGGVVWFGLDNDNNSVIVPVYSGNIDTPPSWAVADRTKLNRKSAYWAFALVDDLVNQYYGLAKPVLDKVRKPLLKELFDNQAAIEQKALDLYKTSPEKAKEFLTDYSSSSMIRVEKVYWELVDKLLYLNNSRGRYR